MHTVEFAGVKGNTVPLEKCSLGHNFLGYLVPRTHFPKILHHGAG